MTRDFCVRLVYSDQQASIWPSWARSDSENGRNQTVGIFLEQLQFAGLRWSCRDWWHQTCAPFHTRKRVVTACWFQLHDEGAQYFSLSPVTTSRVKIRYFAHPSVRNQRTAEFSFEESKCAITCNNDTGILHRSVRNVDPVCFAEATRLSSIWNRVGFSRRLFLPKVKHYLRAAPTSVCNFSVIKMYWK